MNQAFAVVFPGQGSQSVGMLKEYADKYPRIKNTFDEASNYLNYDLWDLVQNGPKDKLNETIYAQPALLTASYALWQVLLEQKQINPTMLAGHSLGEYTALVCAGSLTFKDAVLLVAARGQFMQEAIQSGDGGMVAIIGLDDEHVLSICQQAIESSTEILSPANYNSIGQVVIAGHSLPLSRAMTLAKNAGAKIVTLLPVSVPSHCALMQNAALRLAPVLDSIAFHVTQIPVISNVDVLPYTSVKSIRNGLIRQLTMPVRWVETVQYFIKQEVTTIIECGPGKVLTGLNKRIDTNLHLSRVE